MVYSIKDLKERIKIVSKIEDKAITAKNKAVVKRCMDRINDLEKQLIDRLM